MGVSKKTLAYGIIKEKSSHLQRRFLTRYEITTALKESQIFFPSHQVIIKQLIKSKLLEEKNEDITAFEKLKLYYVK
jgi:hypothetical protein